MAASRELYNATAELSGPGLPVQDYGDSTAAAVPPEMLQVSRLFWRTHMGLCKPGFCVGHVKDSSERQ